MTKISNRLKAIVKFVEKKDKIVDVGCDHGLLSIYLKENNLVSSIIASDINQNALNSAINNIKKRNLEIKTILSDGLSNIDMRLVNTVVISGMGTSTILHILEDDKKIKKINKMIIQSNNDHFILRKSLNIKGYYLVDEEYTFDKGKWYVTCYFLKDDKKNTDIELKYGYLNDDGYCRYLIEVEKKIFKKIPWTSFKDKINEYLKIRNLKKAISSVKR